MEQGDTYDQSGVHIIGIGTHTSGKIRRILFTSKKAYRIAKELDCDVYHLHDPELLPYAVKLKRHGKKVIFDSHEDVPGQLKDKVWIPRLLRKVVAFIYRNFETHVVKKIDAVVTATDHIAKKFKSRACFVITINNYPKMDDIAFHESPFDQRGSIVCYAGGINENRGEKIMHEAMKGVPGELMIAGKHVIEDKDNVHYIGLLNRAGVNDLYRQSVVGLCILKPIENYYYSQPIKMYEYMAAGLPFVCSDFPKWRKIAEESQAGLCVNPSNTDMIREAITRLLTDRALAQKMGAKGRRYVVENCSWESEEKKLIELYENTIMRQSI